jgi:hypothetical protein
MASNDRARARDLEFAAAKIRVRGAHICAGVLALCIAVAPLPANAGDLPNLPGVASPPPLIPAPTGNWVLDWLNMVSASQAAQPHWMTPLVTRISLRLLRPAKRRRHSGQRLPHPQLGRRQRPRVHPHIQYRDHSRLPSVRASHLAEGR